MRRKRDSDLAFLEWESAGDLEPTPYTAFMAGWAAALASRATDRAELEALREALKALIPFAEEHVGLSYRDADVPIVMDDPILVRARALAAAPTAERRPADGDGGA